VYDHGSLLVIRYAASCLGNQLPDSLHLPHRRCLSICPYTCGSSRLANVIHLLLSVHHSRYQSPSCCSRADWQLSFHSTEPADYTSFVAAYKLTTYRPDGSETIGPPVAVISGGHTEAVVYWGGIRGYTAYTNLRVFLTAYTHLSDHK